MRLAAMRSARAARYGSLRGAARGKGQTVKVFLHVGAGKTGTSAIQVALAQNRAVLAEAGILYPRTPDGTVDRAARGEISSGNAGPLGWFCNRQLRARGVTEEQVRDWLQACIREAAGRDLLFSSEAMQGARPEDTAELLRIFRDAGYAPRVIFYVRHILDHATSGYLEHLKWGFSKLPPSFDVRTMNDFIAHYRCRFRQTAEVFAGLVAPGDLIVRLYEAERDRLVPNFFALLSDRVVPASQGTPQVINRSPAPDEVPVFEAVARLPDGPRLCRLLTETILNAPARTRSRLVVDRDAHDAFAARNQPIADQINARFLAGPDRLHVMSDRIILGAPPTPEGPAVFATAIEVLAAAMRRVDAMKQPRQAPRPGGPTATAPAGRA